MHVPGGIRTRSPSKRAVADPRFSLRGHWDQRRTYKEADRGSADQEIHYLLWNTKVCQTAASPP
jgi:hypothetical protein